MEQDRRSTISDKKSMDIDKAAAIYLRRSSSQGKEQSTSIARQRRLCTEAAERLGLTVVQEYNEGEGKSVSHLHSVERPQWDTAMEDAGSVYGTLILEKVDRADRKGAASIGRLLDHAEASGVRVVTCNGQDSSSEAGRLMMVIEGEQARAEIAKSGERIREAKQERRASGDILCGSVPYGHRLVRFLDKPSEIELNEEECEVIRFMVQMYLDGAPFTGVAAACRERGVKTRRGGKINQQWVGSIFRGPHLIGYRQYRKDPSSSGGRGDPDNFFLYSDEEGNPIRVTEPIISDKDFYSVKALREGNLRITAAAKRNISETNKKVWSSGRRASTLLGGLLCCTACGSYLSKMTLTEKKGGKSRYSCRSCAPEWRFDLPSLNDFVAEIALSRVAALNPDSPVLDELSERMVQRLSKAELSEREEVEGEILGLESRKQTLFDGYYERGHMDEETFESLLSRLDLQLSAAHEKLYEMPPLGADLGILGDLTQTADEFNLVGEGSAWDQLPDHLKRTLMLVMVDRVYVDPPKIEQSINSEKLYRAKASVVHDFEGRVQVEFAQENNVIDLASRDRHYPNGKGGRGADFKEVKVEAG